MICQGILRLTRIGLDEQGVPGRRVWQLHSWLYMTLMCSMIWSRCLSRATVPCPQSWLGTRCPSSSQELFLIGHLGAMTQSSRIEDFGNVVPARSDYVCSLVVGSREYHLLTLTLFRYRLSVWWEQKLQIAKHFFSFCFVVERDGGDTA